MFKFLLGLCLVACAVAKHELYDGHALYDVSVTADQIKQIRELVKELNLDVWLEALPERSGHILVPKNQRDLFEKALNAADIDYNVKVENIKEKLDLEDSLLEAASKNNRSADGFLSLDTIHSYRNVNAYLDELAQFYPETVTTVNAGESFEGLDIKYVKISSNNFQDRNKPTVFISSLLHAREWVTLSVSLYAIRKLVVDVTEHDLLQNVDWIILPIANPDGYEYSRGPTRFWRKNRATGFMPGDNCRGVDPNHNFDINWSNASSDDVCADDFHGLRPFSEAETSIIRDIFDEYGHKIELYLDIHSYGSMILYGYGTGQLPPNALGVHVLGVNMAQEIDAVKWPANRNYIVGNIRNVLDTTSGSASDYAMAVGIPFAYTFQLPTYMNSDGLEGYFVEPAFIEQAGHETWQGIKYGARFIVNLRKNKLRN